MTNEDDFQRMLDANKSDHQTRLVFADGLDERGDPRGPGYRALGLLRKSPARASDEDNRGKNYTWFNSDPRAYSNAAFEDHLPNDWCEAIVGCRICPRKWNRNPFSRVLQWTEHTLRREADDAAALAFTMLPEAEQTRLLAGVA